MSQMKVSPQYMALINSIEIAAQEIRQLSKASNNSKKQAQLAHLTNQFNKMKVALDTEKSDHRFNLNEEQKNKLLAMKKLSNREMNSLKKEFFRDILSKYHKRAELIGTIDEEASTVRPALMGQVLRESELIANHTALKSYEISLEQLVNVAKVANTIANTLNTLKDTLPTPYEVKNLSLLQKKSIQSINKNILLNKKAIQMLEKKARKQNWLAYDGLVLKKNDKLFRKLLKSTAYKIETFLSQLLNQFKHTQKKGEDLSPLYKEKRKIQLEIQETLNEAGILQIQTAEGLDFKYSPNGNELLRGMLGLKDENTRSIFKIATSYFKMEQELEKFAPLSPSHLDSQPHPLRYQPDEHPLDTFPMPFSIVSGILQAIQTQQKIPKDLVEINELYNQYENITPDPGDLFFQSNLIKRHEKVTRLVHTLQEILRRSPQLIQHPSLDKENNPFFTPELKFEKDNPGHHIFTIKEILYLIKIGLFVYEGVKLLKSSQYRNQQEMDHLSEIQLRQDAKESRINGGTALHLRNIKEQIHNNYKFIQHLDEIFIEDDNGKDNLKKWLYHDPVKNEVAVGQNLFKGLITAFCKLSQRHLNRIEKEIASDNFHLSNTRTSAKSDFLKKIISRISIVEKIKKPLIKLLREGGIGTVISKDFKTTQLIRFNHHIGGIQIIQHHSNIIEKTLSNAQTIFVLLDAYRQQEPQGISKKSSQVNLELTNKFRDKMNKIISLAQQAFREYKRQNKRIPADLMGHIKELQRELGVIYKSFDPQTRTIINSIFEGPREKLKILNIKLGLQPRKNILQDPTVQYIIHLAKTKGEGAFFKNLTESPSLTSDRIYTQYVEDKSLKQILGAVYEVYNDYLWSKKNERNITQNKKVQRRLSVWMDILEMVNEYFGYPAHWIPILFSDMEVSKRKKTAKFFCSICDDRKMDRLKDITNGLVYHSLNQNNLEIPDVQMFSPEIGSYEMEEVISALQPI